jgi:hypothetical protein
MAANMHKGFGTVTNKTLTFERAIGHLNVFVASGAELQLSFDGGTSFITIPAGFNSFDVGPTTSMIATSTGAFQLLGVQA